MQRLHRVALPAMLLFCTYGALGQHGGHGGGRRGAPGSAGSAGSTAIPGLQDFNHALAVQATPDQASRFLSLAKDTEAARKQAQDLLRLAAKADDPAKFSQHVAALKDAVGRGAERKQILCEKFFKIAEIRTEGTDKKAGQGGLRDHEAKEGPGSTPGTSPGRRRRELPAWRTRWKKRWQSFRPSS